MWCVPSLALIPQPRLSEPLRGSLTLFACRLWGTGTGVKLTPERGPAQASAHREATRITKSGDNIVGQGFRVCPRGELGWAMGPRQKWTLGAPWLGDSHKKPLGGKALPVSWRYSWRFLI